MQSFPMGRFIAHLLSGGGLFYRLEIRFELEGFMIVRVFVALLFAAMLMSCERKAGETYQSDHDFRDCLIEAIVFHWYSEGVFSEDRCNIISSSDGDEIRIHAFGDNNRNAIVNLPVSWFAEMNEFSGAGDPSVEMTCFDQSSEIEEVSPFFKEVPGGRCNWISLTVNGINGTRVRYPPQMSFEAIGRK